MPIQRSQSRSRFAPDVMPEKPPTDARDREVARTAWVSTAAPSPELASLVAKLSPDNLSSTMQVLDELTELTMWKEENQRQLLVLGAPQLLIQLVRSRVKYATQPKDNTAQSSTADQDINAIVRALQVLMRVSTLDDLASLIVNIPGTVALLTELLSHPAVHISVSAARCLLNLTHSSQEAQIQALSAAVLPAAVRLLMSKDLDHGRCKLGCQLLVNLTSGLDGTAAPLIIAQRPVLLRIVAIVLDHVHAPEAVVVLACQLLGNLAQAGTDAQTALAGCGALHALSNLVEMPKLPTVEYAAALQALCAMVMDHPHNTAAFCSHKELAPAISLLLGARSDPLKCTYEDATLVLAAHSLVIVLGHMAANGGQGLPFQPGRTLSGSLSKSTNGRANPQQPSTVATVTGPDTDLVDGHARLVVTPAGVASAGSTDAASNGRAKSQSGAAPALARSDTTKGASAAQVVYEGLASAAQAVGVMLPVGGPVTGKHGEPALSPLHVAELRHRVTDILLPRLRSPNHRTAMVAAAALYHLVAACGGDTAREARGLLSDSSLIEQLLACLSSGHAGLTHASLAVLDVLVPEPVCAKILLALRWLQPVTPLLEHSNALVRRWAERLLCGAYAATRA